ncbi:hypothetical protein [Flavobacterium sp.]
MRKEVKLILFYITYVSIFLFTDSYYPSGPCTPGPGCMLFLLLIPISVILFVWDAYWYIRQRERQSLTCMLIHPPVWIIILTGLI